MAANQSNSKYPQSVLLKGADFQSLPQMKHFLSSEAIGTDVYLAHFKSNRATFNHGHNFFGITLRGREIFLRLIISLAHYLSFQLSSVNCDGGILTSKAAISFSKNRPYVLGIDDWIRPNLSEKAIEEYIELKFYYFLYPNVCLQHIASYNQHLIDKKVFIPKQCCVKYKSMSTNDFKLKVVNSGDRAVILGINRSLVIDKASNEPMIKCSGLKGKTLDEFIASCSAEMQERIVAAVTDD